MASSGTGTGADPRRSRRRCGPGPDRPGRTEWSSSRRRTRPRRRPARPAGGAAAAWGSPPPEEQQGGADDRRDHQHGADRDHERARSPLRSQPSLDLLTLASELGPFAPLSSGAGLDPASLGRRWSTATPRSQSRKLTGRCVRDEGATFAAAARAAYPARAFPAGAGPAARPKGGRRVSDTKHDQTGEGADARKAVAGSTGSSRSPSAVPACGPRSSPGSRPG